MYKNHVKITRFDNNGFNCKPYTSPAYHHVFEFIHTEITDLYYINQSIPKSSLHRPKENDWNWSGCFCFLDQYDKNILSKNSPLAMRQGHKQNIAFLRNDEVIWVRNCSHLGKENPYFNVFKYPVEHEGKEYWFSDSSRFDSYRWVRMRVDLVLERTRLWKELNSSAVPEWLTEFFLMEEQAKKLISPSLKEKTGNIFINLKNYII